MKIVNRKTFLALPAETLFSKYTPCMLSEFAIKGDTVHADGVPIDFMFQQIHDAVACDDAREFSEVLELAEIRGDSFSMDLDCQMRDGCFDEEQLFAVWEPEDVAGLVARLQRCPGSSQVAATAVAEIWEAAIDAFDKELRQAIREAPCKSTKPSIIAEVANRLHELQAQVGKNNADTGGGCSMCHGTPAINVSGTHWLCGPCVNELFGDSMDAIRYRHLRECNEFGVYRLGTYPAECYFGTALDEAIDAALDADVTSRIDASAPPQAAQPDTDSESAPAGADRVP